MLDLITAVAQFIPRALQGTLRIDSEVLRGEMCRYHQKLVKLSTSLLHQ